MEIEEYKKLAEEEVTSFWHLGRREILNEALERCLCLGKNYNICDVGCGTGGNMKFLNSWGSVTGVDSSSEALKFAESFSFKELVQSDASQLPFDEGSFDLATTLDVLEHITDDNKTIRDVYRILKPNSYFLITVPAFQWLWGRHDVFLHHQRRYTRRELCRQLQNAGFSIVESSYFMTLGIVDHIVRNMKDFLVPPSGNARSNRRHIKFFSSIVDFLLLWIIRIEKYLLRIMRLPFGTSILIVAQKPLFDIKMQEKLFMPFDHMNKLYNSKNSLVKFVHNNRLDSIVAKLKIKKGKILDAGCGEGHLLEKLYNLEKNNEYYGIDVTSAAIEQAKKRCSFATIKFGNLFETKYSNNLFDVIICTEVLEHIIDYKLVFVEFDRILKPGGILIVTFPNEILWTVCRFFLGRRPIKTPDHYNSFLPKSFKKFINMRIVSERSLPFKLPFFISLGYLIVFEKNNFKNKS